MLSRPISLVPVTLREAALDSPTFRGTVVHYGEQVELVEKWLEGYLKATLKLCRLEEVVNNYLGKGVPNGVSESIIDQDYTLLAIRRFAEGSRGFWGAVVNGAKKVEQTVVEPLLGFQRSELRVFKESRRSLEITQAKYDSLLARYAGLSKSKEPSSLREDAFQLYEARKLYIRACLDFCVAAPIFRASLDRILTKVLSDQSREQIRLRREGTAAAEKYAAEMDRIRAWSEGMEQSDKVFRKELLMTRKELEEKVKRELHPARELEEYASSTVPYLSSKGPGIAPEGENISSEKQGWLFMRTLTGKPTRSVWVRRWFFVREGIFGWLMQGYRGGAMEESEKIGVLLCNIKPAFQEERRFCFGVKTKDTTILLQSETQAELTSWLSVFEQAKRTAVESASSTASTQAFSIIPPSAPVLATEPAYITKGHDGNNVSSAFASQSTGKDGISLNPLSMSRHLLVHRERGNDGEASGIDRSLTMPLNPLGSPPRGTSFDISRNDNPTPVTSGAREKIAQKLDIQRKTGSTERNQSSVVPPVSPSNNNSGSGVGISALISASHNALPFHPPASPPADGKFTDGPSSLAPTTLASTPAPVTLSKAAMVTSGQEPINDDFGSKGHRKTQSLDATVGPHLPGGGDNLSGGKDEYPPGYPPELRAQDNHFRVLFPGRRSGEVVLLVFRATWSPNDTQELPGRCYVTVDNVYFYSHYLGLVFTSVIPLTSITEVKAVPGKDCDYLFLHLDPEEEDVGVEQEGHEPQITIKIFLEPVRLLQRRLLFLVKNANALSEDDPPKLPARKVLERLIALERELEERTGTDTESWEDVGFVDVHDELERRKRTGELVRVRIDGDILTSHPTITQRGIDGKVKEVTRFKLPSVPVVYEPEGMDKKAFEREFEVSPKAMFHVMFGDKSAVFQMLYHERRARHIQQGAWTQLDDGRMRREFKYQIEYHNILRRLQISNVVDHQTIEKQDDHLCYVITDRKTPWHLPHREHFMLVSKVVITHVAKSKCKLSIWTAVEWAKEPTFSKGIVHRQALDDLDLDALDLGDVVADQARKLGSQSLTEKAAYVFGGIGQETPGSYLTAGELDGTPLASDLDPRAPRLPIAHRSLSQMMLETGLSFLESAVSSLMMWTFAALQKAWGIASAQRIILLFLAVSLLSNMMLSSRSTVSYWNERRAAKFMNAVGVSPNGIMSRVVYLKDMDEIVLNGTDLVHDSSSQCYAKFRELASFTDMDADAALASKGFSSASTRATAQRLRLSRQNLGSYRHDLLVAMRVVNSLERDMVHAEWDNWLFEETSRCKQALFILNSRKPPAGSAGQSSISEGDDRGERSEAAKWLSEYCDSCSRERSESDTGRRLGLAFP
ncbi:hypothetical protein L873DRAFT_1827902 [Choiromyces venosus 120613-1]|uniref:Uncharacterized protein n=1 Tax=Choiromyces venosus 120613-1 TaxID=1336337 RepID=A0A3N4K1N1_9PEZI|nr:hypothetical protein L873DRAFT_1827902 [Choiromyces venosus 120613-1]